MRGAVNVSSTTTGTEIFSIKWQLQKIENIYGKRKRSFSRGTSVLIVAKLLKLKTEIKY